MLRRLPAIAAASIFTGYLALSPLQAQTTSSVTAAPAAASTAAPTPAPTPAVAAVASTSTPSPATSLPAASGLRLYALDCGRIQLPDMGMFSDTGEYDGQRGTVVTPCFLVSHPSGTLLWDTGLGDGLAGKGAVPVDGGVILQVDRTLESQLASIGVSHVDFLAFSHFHFDHTGNAASFPQATWLINQDEMTAALEQPDAFINPDHLRVPTGTKQLAVDGDFDVFGDGTVKILRTPGHTDGHQVLLVRLGVSGPVILSGDLYHTLANRKYQRVPTLNASRADTLASMNRIETIASNLGARVIVQHDPEEFAALPQLPAFLE